MPKTPDETKKGLNDPIPVHFHIGDPEPRLTPLAMVDLEELHADALGLIQQLEKRVIHLEALNQSNLTTITMQERTRARLQERISQLEAERDAAVRDLTEMAQDTDESCEYCKMFKTPHCSRECRMKNKGFEWRGVTKEE